MAKYADIVVPSTTAFERDDYSGSRNDPLLMAMPKMAEPYAQSRDDYTTFAALAEALGFAEQFTEGRTARQISSPAEPHQRPERESQHSPSAPGQQPGCQAVASADCPPPLGIIL